MFITTLIHKQKILVPDYLQILTSKQIKYNLDDEFMFNTIKLEHPKAFHELAQNNQEHIQKTEQVLALFAEKLKPYTDDKVKEDSYITFKIPKKTGGLREIRAPKPEFKQILRELTNAFQYTLNILPHNSAYAYVPNRDCLKALEIHKKYKNHWFLKIDLQHFFDSCTTALVYAKLINLYPFYYVSDEAKRNLRTILEACTYNDALPQGSPVSPILTNLLMVEYDYNIQQYLAEKLERAYTYTRYADDLIIGSKNTFDWQTVTSDITAILSPFLINAKKTRYGSNAGRNWNLGLMLNKDHQITIGAERKRNLKAKLNNFLHNYTTENNWPPEAKAELLGQLGYFKHIEPAYAEYIMNKYARKYNVNLTECFK